MWLLWRSPCHRKDFVSTSPWERVLSAVRDGTFLRWPWPYRYLAAMSRNSSRDVFHTMQKQTCRDSGGSQGQWNCVHFWSNGCAFNQYCQEVMLLYAISIWASLLVPYYISSKDKPELFLIGWLGVLHNAESLCYSSFLSPEWGLSNKKCLEVSNYKIDMLIRLTVISS